MRAALAYERQAARGSLVGTAFAAGVLVLTLAPIVGALCALCGARIGEAFDRRREVTGESADGDEESSR